MIKARFLRFQPGRDERLHGSSSFYSWLELDPVRCDSNVLHTSIYVDRTIFGTILRIYFQGSTDLSDFRGADRTGGSPRNHLLERDPSAAESGRILRMEGYGCRSRPHAFTADGQLERVSELTTQRLLAVAGNRPGDRRMACSLSTSGSHQAAPNRVAGDGHILRYPSLLLVRHTTQRASAF